jgi:hypothetical protein
MKQQNFNLLDQVYSAVILAIIEKIMENGIKPVIVGGLALQFHLLNIMKNEGIEINEQYFRKTDDVDMCVISSTKEQDLREAINALDGLEIITEKMFVVLRLQRDGKKRTVIEFTALDENNEVSRDFIKLNISSTPEEGYSIPSSYFDEQSKHAVKFKIYGRDFYVNDLSIIVATKLSLGRPKDLLDLENLACLLSRSKKQYLELNKVYKILQEAVKEGKAKPGLDLRYRKFAQKAGFKVNEEEVILC